jgi:metallo-beta-lactamase class B
MRRLAAVAGAFLVAATAAAVPPAGSPAPAFRTEFAKLGDHVWMHTSFARYGGYRTPSNGLIVEGPRSVILVDTAWDAAQTAQILGFIYASIGKPVGACIITHSHADRAGGLPVVFGHRIPVLMTAATRGLLALAGQAGPVGLLGPSPLDLDGVAVDWRFPGPAHAPDNITLWFPAERLLFAGCIAKAADARDIGNTADADLANWPAVIRFLQAGYPEVRLVVPGHGAPGGPELLSHTAKLLAR